MDQDTTKRIPSIGEALACRGFRGRCGLRRDAVFRDHGFPDGFLLAFQVRDLRRDVVAGHRGDRQANQNNSGNVVRSRLLLLCLGDRIGLAQPLFLLGELLAGIGLVLHFADIGRRDGIGILRACGDQQCRDSRKSNSNVHICPHEEYLPIVLWIVTYFNLIVPKKSARYIAEKSFGGAIERRVL